MGGLINLLRYVKPYRSKVLLSVLSNILLSVFTVISIPLIIPFFQLLFNQQPIVTTEPAGLNPAHWVEYGFSLIIKHYDRSQALLFVCSAIIVVFLLKNLFRYLSLYFMTPVRNGVVRDLRSRLFHSYSNMSLHTLNNSKKGDLIARATIDVQEVEWSILNVIEAIFKAPLVIFGSIVLMVYISPQLSLFVLILLIFTGLVIGGIGKTLKRSSARAQNYIGKVTSVLEETLSGLKVLKVYNANRYFFERFESHNSRYMQIMNSVLRRRDMSSPLTEFLGVTVVVILLFYGSQEVFNGSLSPEYFFAFIFAFYQVIEPSKSFASAYYNIQKGVAALDRIEDMFRRQPGSERSHFIEIEEFKKGIEFKNVTFTYPGTEEVVLQDVSFDIHRGEKVAIIGASGSGKTTLIDLLMGFYGVTEGKITIDGNNIEDISPESLHRLFGLVTQTPFLFNDTIENNILLGLNETRIGLREAAQIAYADEFIDQLPDGFNTNIGDSGVKLSGGQRQRITIARAIMKDPPILVLDEASSSLDSASESYMKKALEKAMKERTAIIIAHRLSTIKNVDRIIVLKDGKISEIGTHAELASHDGEYNKYVLMQNYLD